MNFSNIWFDVQQPTTTEIRMDNTADWSNIVNEVTSLTAQELRNLNKRKHEDTEEKAKELLGIVQFGNNTGSTIFKGDEFVQVLDLPTFGITPFTGRKDVSTTTTTTTKKKDESEEEDEKEVVVVQRSQRYYVAYKEFLLTFKDNIAEINQKVKELENAQQKATDIHMKMIQFLKEQGDFPAEVKEAQIKTTEEYLRAQMKKINEEEDLAIAYFNKLEKIKWRRIDAKSEVTDSCQVCFENFSLIEKGKLRTLSCGHVICEACHEQLSTATCPTCRKRIAGWFPCYIN